MVSDEDYIEISRFANGANNDIKETLTSGNEDSDRHISGHEWYEIQYKDQFIRVYRSELVADDIHEYDGLIDSTYNSLSLEEDTSDETAPLSSHLLFDFVYSNDSKFIVAVDFCENLEGTKDYFYEVAQAVEKFEEGADTASATDSE